MKPVDTLTRRLVVSVPSSTWTPKWPGSISVTAMSVIGGPVEDRHGGSGPWSAIGKAGHRSLQPRVHEGGVVSGIETEHEHPFEAGRA
jgi:hypothetical protein